MINGENQEALWKGKTWFSSCGIENNFPQTSNDSTFEILHVLHRKTNRLPPKKKRPIGAVEHR
jgi:hypothetical protein